MKKSLFALVLVAGCLMSQYVMAQNTGLYFFTGGTYVSSGLALGKDSKYDENYSYSNLSSGYLSVGTGYKSNGGLGFEIGFLMDETHVKGRSGADSSDFGLKGSLYHSSPVTDNINWSFFISYCNLTVSSQTFHDIQIEPFVFEYRRRNSRWGFRLSPITIEAMTTVREEEKKGNSFIGSSNMGVSAIGVSVNSFPIQIAFYL
jgi:hypothetical protein